MLLFPMFCYNADWGQRVARIDFSCWHFSWFVAALPALMASQNLKTSNCNSQNFQTFWEKAGILQNSSEQDHSLVMRRWTYKCILRLLLAGGINVLAPSVTLTRVSASLLLHGSPTTWQPCDLHYRVLVIRLSDHQKLSLKYFCTWWRWFLLNDSAF